MTNQCATHGLPTERPPPTPTDRATRSVMAPHGAQAPARAGTLAATTGRSPAAHGIRIEAYARIRLARVLSGLPDFLLPALILATPSGLAQFVRLIAPASLPAPELVRPHLPPAPALVVPVPLMPQSVATP